MAYFTLFSAIFKEFKWFWLKLTSQIGISVVLKNLLVMLMINKNSKENRSYEW